MIGLDVERYRVGREHPLDHLVAPGQGAKNLGWWERNVEKEIDASAVAQLTQKKGHAHEVKIVHPDSAAWPGQRLGRLGKTPVHLRVDIPVLSVEGRLFREAMKQWPKRAVREAVIVVLHVPLTQRHSV